MRRERQPETNRNRDHRDEIARARSDLALLFTTDLHVGTEKLYQQRRTGSPLSLQYELDDALHCSAFRTPVLWRAISMMALQENSKLIIHEMDQPGRYRRMFPKTLLGRLQWHARLEADFPPVARLYDPDGKSEMLLTRSRCCGHAVDALHNLSAGGPVFQPIWISDIIALRPLLGIALVRDEAFSTSTRISAYLEAAAITGRIVRESELLSLPLTGMVTRLELPPPSRAVADIFEQECRRNPTLAALKGRSIYDEYRFTEADGKND